MSLVANANSAFVKHKDLDLCIRKVTNSRILARKLDSMTSVGLMHCMMTHLPRDWIETATILRVDLVKMDVSDRETVNFSHFEESPRACCLPGTRLSTENNQNFQRVQHSAPRLRFASEFLLLLLHRSRRVVEPKV
jgi:hypothetical protein